MTSHVLSNPLSTSSQSDQVHLRRADATDMGRVHAVLEGLARCRGSDGVSLAGLQIPWRNNRPTLLPPNSVADSEHPLALTSLLI